jgi:membrane associated rhomboid family serine protease
MTTYFQNESKQEVREIIVAALYPLTFVFALWVIYFAGQSISCNMAFLGIHPLQASGLIGIITAPLIHANFDHLLSNSSALLLFGFGLCFFYKRKAIPIFLFIYVLSGFWGWFLARSGYHIGASGLIYGMYFFLVTSAVIKKEKRTIAFSLLMTFLYGTIIWGFFPVFFPGKAISWEIHTTGAVAGIVAAFYFRGEGPQPPALPDDDTENDDDDDDENAYWKTQDKVTFLCTFTQILEI